MPRVRSRNVFQRISDFDKGQIVAYRDCVCGLSYRSIAARFGRDPMAVSKIWKRWVHDKNSSKDNGYEVGNNILGKRRLKYIEHQLNKRNFYGRKSVKYAILNVNERIAASKIQEDRNIVMSALKNHTFPLQTFSPKIGIVSSTSIHIDSTTKSGHP
ncbi:hypothetical protein TNCV_3167401 [Trichonephila clavipes]|uniref:Uncharacterized protein n=1 Tax=Trichonephila clavipes TaxID=2585209 RepID=A0A8X6RET8_TRICX|nr:hypothetical protein TNCV_3167401 [Trichonephila clavipes]